MWGVHGNKTHKYNYKGVINKIVVRRVFSVRVFSIRVSVIALQVISECQKYLANMLDTNWPPKCLQTDLQSCHLCHPYGSHVLLLQSTKF